MKMIRVCFVALVLAAASGSAVAYENYIPLGTGYSTDVDTLPAFDSEAGQVSQQTDVYETELYLENLKRKKQEDFLNSFSTQRGATGAGVHMDY